MLLKSKIFSIRWVSFEMIAEELGKKISCERKACLKCQNSGNSYRIWSLTISPASFSPKKSAKDSFTTSSTMFSSLQRNEKDELSLLIEK